MERLRSSGAGCLARRGDGARVSIDRYALSFGACCLIAGVALVVGASSALAANDPPPRAGRNDHQAFVTFDVPAQPLISALEAYGATSGWQVVYDGTLVTGRRSAEVKGTFTPAAALQKLLAGTGLSPRYMAADGFVLVRDPTPHPVNAPPVLAVAPASSPAVSHYYGLVQAGLRESFCANQRIRSGKFRAAVGLWVGSSGVVTQSGLLDSTGDPVLDTAVERALRGVDVGEPPPAGFAQPVVVVITPNVIRDCLAIQNGLAQTKAGP